MRAYDQRNYAFYFLPGFAFPKQSTIFNVAALPTDCIPTREGKAVLPVDREDFLPLLAYLNSTVVRFFVDATNGLHKQSGPIGLIPVPRWEESVKLKLSRLAQEITLKVAETYTYDETSRYFWAPTHQTSLVVNGQDTLDVIGKSMEQIDETIFDALGVLDADRAILEAAPAIRWSIYQPSVKDVLSYALGCVFGRWDIRCTSRPVQREYIEDPFASLPVCPPGMLQKSTDVLVKFVDSGEDCPLDICESGILVADPGHEADITLRVGEALAVIWGDAYDNNEQKACEVLGVSSLLTYLNTPSNFFADHLSRYSRTRRVAPIYWPLGTATGSYTIWLYYHRLTNQTLYQCVNDFVDPKSKQVAEQLTTLRHKLHRTREEERALEQLATLDLELADFRAELLRVAPFWKPDLNDGVQITAAPLYRLINHRPWRNRLQETWERLEAGEYDWAHLAYSIWPERVREKCRTDQSLAIAHGLERLYVEPATAPSTTKSNGKRGEGRPAQNVDSQVGMELGDVD